MKRFRDFLTTTLIGGVAVILPILIFVWVVRLLLALVHAAVAPLTGLIDWQIPVLFIDVLALGSVIILCFFTGLAVRTRFGHGIYYYIEKQWLEKLPVYAAIRDTVQQFTGMKNTPFNQVVLIEVFGTKMTGFVTDEEGENVSVFVPTAPNPTNGFVFHTLRSNLEFLDVKTEDALRTVVAMGSGSQELFKDESKKVVGR